MLAGSISSAPTEIAAVVAPVALYFLVLGLLNSRSHPQLLSGRLDFAILTVAISPLLLLPLMAWLGFSVLFAVALAFLLGAGVLVLAPRGTSWVIYNVHAEQALSAVGIALRRMGLEVQDVGDGYSLDGGARVQVGGFSPLRNASIRLHGGDKQLAQRFEQALWEVLRGYEVQASPMAVSLLLVAAAMFVAPLALMAHRVPEIVRLLTDLVH
jgi:hypothetical protein